MITDDKSAESTSPLDLPTPSNGHRSYPLRDVPGISSRMLTATLRHLECDGLLGAR